MKETATKIRTQIVGTELSAVTFVRDYVQLAFDGPSFNVLTPITVSSQSESFVTGNTQFRNRLCGQIGKMVTDVTTEERQSLLIVFADRSSISLSLKEADYPGPEAVIFNGPEGVWVVI